MRKKESFKLKKIPYYLVLFLLTAGASLILGFLSFSGMYALYPFIFPAFATFNLSVIYEMQIYLENIISAFNKLFQIDYLEQHLAQHYLETFFPQNKAINYEPFFNKANNYPQFIQDYAHQHSLLSSTQNNSTQHQLIAEQLEELQQWFATQLFKDNTKNNDANSDYISSLQLWLETNQQKHWQEQLKKRRIQFRYVTVFSSFSALFMGLGSTYLLVEAFSVIPFIATIPFALWPALIVPMAVIAGTAYGFLTFNTITDLINNDSIRKWYNTLKQDIAQKGWTGRTVLLTVLTLGLTTLSLALTICTAGTWWTIAANARPLFSWMSKMPKVILGVFNPIITALSAIFFNIENVLETLNLFYKTMNSEESFWQNLARFFSEKWNNLKATENNLQIANPFRMLLSITIPISRITLFFGHLWSISLTTDRMPGVPQPVSAGIALVSEGAEDSHYFAEGEEDIPTKLLHLLATPIHLLATLWDVLASQLNRDVAPDKKVLSFNEAWTKQRGIIEPIAAPPLLSPLSPQWKQEHALYLIEQQQCHLKKATMRITVAQEKINTLQQLKDQIRQQEPQQLSLLLERERSKPVYQRQRFFAFDQRTETQLFIDDLAARMGA